MLSKEVVVLWNEIEHVLYEENGHKFIVMFDLFNNHTDYYHCKDGFYRDLCRSSRDDIYDAIAMFNKIITEED